MQKTKFFVVKVYEEYYALKCNHVVDILEGFSNRTIEKFTSESNTQLFYKAEQLHLIDVTKVFKNSGYNPKMTNSILVIKDIQHISYQLFGLPISEITGFSYLEDNLLYPVRFFKCNEYCSCSFEHDNRLIHLLDVRKMIDSKTGRKIFSPVTAYYS
jgi:hypothetical protein